jgi:hypothetical protein
MKRLTSKLMRLGLFVFGAVALSTNTHAGFADTSASVKNVVTAVSDASGGVTAILVAVLVALVAFAGFGLIRRGIGKAS